MNYTTAKLILASTIVSLLHQSPIFGFPKVTDVVRNLWERGDRWKAVVGATCSKEQLERNFLQAVKNNNIKEVQTFIELGVNVNTRDNLGRTALMFAAHVKNLAMIRMLRKARADVSICDNKGRSALEYALIEHALI